MFKIYHENSLNISKYLNAGSVDCIVCSPPYKKKDGFEFETMLEIFRQCYVVAKSGTLLFMNFGELAESPLRPYELTVALSCNTYWKFQQSIVWQKNHYTPLNGTHYVNRTHEPIFIFYKDEMPDLDRLAVGVPYADKSNVGRYADKDLRCGGSVWKIDYPTIQKASQKLHHDRFPVELPTRCIKLANLKKGSIVLDPFSGSGTSGIAALNLGHNYVGFELDEYNAEVSLKRLTEHFARLGVKDEEVNH